MTTSSQVPLIQGGSCRHFFFFFFNPLPKFEKLAMMLRRLNQNTETSTTPAGTEVTCAHTSMSSPVYILHPLKAKLSSVNTLFINALHYPIFIPYINCTFMGKCVSNDSSFNLMLTQLNLSQQLPKADNRCGPTHTHAFRKQG